MPTVGLAKRQLPSLTVEVVRRPHLPSDHERQLDRTPAKRTGDAELNRVCVIGWLCAERA
jgi:hypothetical protein